jgi:Ca-activated chloride channel family protein
LPANAQYYLRGEVKDEQGRFLPLVKIQLHSKSGFPYYSGSSGVFGIPSSLKIDTVTLTLDGYETLKKPVETSKYQTLVMKMLSGLTNTTKQRLSSVTKNALTNKPHYADVMGGESYSNAIENDFVDAKTFPETGFALNVDRASYSNIRRFINMKMKVPPEAVRIEEMLNYFNLRKEVTPEDGVFAATTSVTSCPWNAQHHLLFLNIKAKKLDLTKVPPSNLVFLIDVSGSMDMPNRLPLVQSAFKLLVENLRPIDSVTIVTYGGVVSLGLAPTSGAEKQKIIDAIEGLVPDGDTPGETAIKLAYKMAQRSFINGGNNRVILATDGDFNVGQSTEKELEEMIAKYRQSGIYLTCLGVGMGNYKDSKLEALAKRGNGNFAYLDNEKEVEKVLVKEFTQTLFAVANDVFLDIAFNPDMVMQYRLIGFDNKLTAITDSSSELEGGEIGGGHAMMALFEIVPTPKNISVCLAKDFTVPLANIKLRYQKTGDTKLMHQNFHVPHNFKDIQVADSTIRFAAAVALFGAALKESKHINTNDNWDFIKNLAVTASTPNNLLQMEFVELIDKAKKIYAPNKKSKRGIWGKKKEDD